MVQFRKKLQHEVATVEHLQWRIHYRQSQQTLLEAQLDYAYASHAPSKDLDFPKATASPKGSSSDKKGLLRTTPFLPEFRQAYPSKIRPRVILAKEDLEASRFSHPSFVDAPFGIVWRAFVSGRVVSL